MQTKFLRVWRWHCLTFAATAALLLAGCSNFGPQNVLVPMDKLQASLAKQFPYNNDFARLVDVSLTQPKLRALTDENRLGTEVDISIAPRFMNRKFPGKLAMDSALRFEPSDNTVRLVKPRVSKLDFAGMKTEDSVGGSGVSFSKLAEFAVENAMNDMIVYQVKADDLKRLGTQWVPGEFKVTSAGLSVTLTPQK